MGHRQDAGVRSLVLRRRDLIALLGGAAVAWPLVGRTQPKAMPVVGWLSSTSPGSSVVSLAGFRQGLSDTGYGEGQNLTIEYRWAEGNYDRLPNLANELVGRNVDVIIASAPPAAFAAKNATATIPIVFSVGIDPVAAGLVASLPRPGGNLTGVSLLLTDLTPKRLELLSELVPAARLIALLVNPNNANTERIIPDVQEAVRVRGLNLAVLKASNDSEIETAFATLGQLHADALVIGEDPFLFQRGNQLVALSIRHVVPTIYTERQFSAAGGLISYGPSLAVTYRQVGIYAGKILQGAKPADLPVVQPTKLELMVNLKTAKTLGLTVPQSILARADEVIE